MRVTSQTQPQCWFGTPQVICYKQQTITHPDLMPPDARSRFACSDNSRITEGDFFFFFFWQAARHSCCEFVLQFVSYLIVKQGVIWLQLEATRARGAHSHNSELLVTGSVVGITSLITPFPHFKAFCGHLLLENISEMD